MTISYGFNRFDMRSADQFSQSVMVAEDLGFDYAFIPSSPLLVADPYILLSAAARSTQRIRLGPLLENPVVRHPAVIAGSISTLDRVSNGRANVVLGVGDTAVRTLGLQPATVNNLGRAVKDMKTLLNGDKADFGTVQSKLRHAESVPVWVAAGGPKTLAMAGQYADGVVIRVGTHSANIDAALDAITRGALDAGRNPEQITIAAVFHTVMSHDRAETGHIGRAIAAGYFEYAPYLFDNLALNWDGPTVEVLKQQVWQDFHHTPDLVSAGKLVSFLPESAVDDFCLHGGSSDIRTQIDRIVAAHPQISLIVPHPMTAPGGDNAEFMVRFATEVM
jgi:5,10-methylenetetrahydromethanopterin reductase